MKTLKENADNKEIIKKLNDIIDWINQQPIAKTLPPGSIYDLGYMGKILKKRR